MSISRDLIHENQELPTARFPAGAFTVSKCAQKATCPRVYPRRLWKNILTKSLILLYLDISKKKGMWRV